MLLVPTVIGFSVPISLPIMYSTLDFYGNRFLSPSIVI